MSWRQLLQRLSGGHDKGPLVLLGVLVLLTSLAATLGVRALARGSDDALQQAVDALPPRAAGMTVTINMTQLQGIQPVTPNVLDHGTNRLEAAMTSDLKDAFAAPTWWVSTTQVGIHPGEKRGRARYLIDLRAQQDLADHVRLVEGAFPGVGHAGSDQNGPLFEVVVTAHSAETLGLEVGDEVDTDPTKVGFAAPGVVQQVPMAGRLKVTGIVDVTDPESPYWAQTSTVGDGWTVGLGTDIPEYHGVGFLAPEASSTLALADLADRPVVGWWIPTDGADVSAAQAATLAAAIREFTTTAPRNVVTLGLPSVAAVSAAGLERLFEQFAAGRAALGAPLGVAISGLVGVALLVLVLAAALVSDRRATLFALARARGASSLQLALVALAQTALIAVPMAALGVVIGDAVLPAEVGATSWAHAAVICAVVIAAAAIGAVRAGRLARAPAAGASARTLVAELALLVICLGALALARRQPVDVDATGANPLLASVPWLLGIVASMLALHLSRPVLSWLTSRLARRQGAAGFLGLVRASRADTGSRLVTIAVITTLATTLFTATVSTAVQDGQLRAAWEQVQGDVRIDNISAQKSEIDAVREMPGVDVVAQVFLDEGVSVRRLLVDRGTLVAVDPAALAAIMRDSPLPALSALSEPAADGLPPVVLNRSAARLGDTDTVSLVIDGDVVTGRVAQVVDTIPLVPDNIHPVALVPISALPVVPEENQRANTVLLRGDLSTQQVEELRAMFPRGDVQSRAEVFTDLRDAGFSLLLTRAFAVTTAASGAYALLALAMWLVVTAAARAAFLSILRTLGLTTRQAGRVVSAEITPIVLLAVAVGGLAGWALTWVASPALDVGQLTAGAQAQLRTQPWVALTFTVAAALTVLLAVALLLRYQRRRSPTDVLRLGGET